jgi:modification methylase
MDINLNRIYVGDTLKTLQQFPDNLFHVIVLSPPYNKNKVSGALVWEVKYENYCDSKNELLYQKNQIEVLNELYRVAAPTCHIFYNHKLRWVDGIMIHPMTWISQTKWNMRQEIIWDRSIAGNIRGWRFWQVDERIYWMQKGIMKGDELCSKHAKMSSIWKITPENKFPEHPAPFPVTLPTRCIYSVADNQTGWNILDPYCGIGTTLVAAKALKHNYIGIDCSQEYVNIANHRLDIMNEGCYIEAEMEKHTVVKSYAERKKNNESRTKS